MAAADGDVATGALWLAAEDWPGLTPEPWLGRIDDLAGELSVRCGVNGCSPDDAPLVAALLRDRLKLHGAGGGDPRNHYLHHGAAVRRRHPHRVRCAVDRGGDTRVDPHQWGQHAWTLPRSSRRYDLRHGRRRRAVGRGRDPPACCRVRRATSRRDWSPRGSHERPRATCWRGCRATFAGSTPASSSGHSRCALLTAASILFRTIPPNGATADSCCGEWDIPPRRSTICVIISTRSHDQPRIAAASRRWPRACARS